MEKSEKVLVIGATGFIGRQIAIELIQQGFEVSGLHRNKLNKDDQLIKNISWVKGNLNNNDSLINAFEDIDIIIFSAGFYPNSKNQLTLQENLNIAQSQTINLIECAKTKNIKKIIYTSSFSTIPINDNLKYANESSIYLSGSLEDSIYHEVKILIESLLLSNKNPIPTVSLNPTAVFGPGDYHLSLGKLLMLFAKKQGFFWLDTVINVIDVRDVAMAHVKAIGLGNPGERYVLGGYNFTLREWITETNTILGFKKPWLKIPLSMIRILILLKKMFPILPIPANHLHGLEYWTMYDNSKAKKKLALSIRPYRETVIDTVKWFKDKNYL